MQAAEVGQNCACLFALLPSVFLWPLSASWPQLFTDGYWSWDALQRCLHHPLQPGVGSLPVHPMWTRHPCGQAACGTLRSLALGSRRDVEELFPSELESNQPQTKHPAKLSWERSWRWQEAPLAAFPCCAPRDHSPSLPPGTPCPARSCDRMASHPQRCRGGTHSVGQ